MKTMNYAPTWVRRLRINRRETGRAKPVLQPPDAMPPYAAVLSLLTASRHVHAALATLMGVGVFSEAQLVTLVTLYSLDPLPATAAELSRRADVSRQHMTLVIDSLVARNFLAQDTGRANRSRHFIRLTEQGRAAAVLTAHRFLEAVDGLTRGISSNHWATLDGTCRHLTQRAVASMPEATLFPHRRPADAAGRASVSHHAPGLDRSCHACRLRGVGRRPG